MTLAPSSCATRTKGSRRLTTLSGDAAISRRACPRPPASARRPRSRRPRCLWLVQGRGPALHRADDQCRASRARGVRGRGARPLGRAQREARCRGTRLAGCRLGPQGRQTQSRRSRTPRRKARRRTSAARQVQGAPPRENNQERWRRLKNERTSGRGKGVGRITLPMTHSGPVALAGRTPQP